jgi:bifunctional non-homologous end joining protein LigD
MRAAPLRVGNAPLRNVLPKSRRQYGTAPMPEFVEPQLALLVEGAPRAGWVHEIKFDGYRMQGRISKGKCVLRSRKGLDWTHRFPEIAKACEKLPDCIIDGEICGLDKHGLPSFSGLQQSLSDKKTSALVFYIFDLLWLQEEDYRPYALATRKKVLERLLKKVKSPRVLYVEHHDVDGAGMFRIACEMKLEGIVSKSPDAKYVSGRPGLWKKVKCRPRQELIICGWKMNGMNFASLILGAYRGGKLHYVGTAGTGFNGTNLPPLMAKLKKLERERRLSRSPRQRRLRAPISLSRRSCVRSPSRPGLVPERCGRRHSKGCGRTSQQAKL